MNNITPFKNRVLDLNKKVKVYRNLTRKGVVYSIKQDNHVVAYSSDLTLKDVDFVVNKTGQKRVRENKQRNVHAYAVGYIEFVSDKDFNNVDIITYNPYYDDEFRYKNGSDKKYIYNAPLVTFKDYVYVGR